MLRYKTEKGIKESDPSREKLIGDKLEKHGISLTDMKPG